MENKTQWNDKIDGYDIFVEKFIDKDNGDAFINWAINDATIFIEKNVAQKAWNELKKAISCQEEVDIRLKKGADEFNKQIKEIYGKYGIKIKRDNDGNCKTEKRLRLTGYRKVPAKQRNIFNYTIVHVWDYTKNPYLFSAPWNLCYMPTVAASLTDHMAKGPLAEKMQQRLKEKVMNRYKDLIDDYNRILREINAEQISNDIKSTFSGHALEEMKKQWESIELQNKTTK